MREKLFTHHALCFTQLFRLALIGDSLHGLFDGFGVGQVLALDRAQVCVQIVDQGDARGDVQADDLVVGDVVQVFDQRAQAVAVRRDDDTLAGLDGRRNHVIPVGQDPIHGILQTLGQRHIGRIQILIAAVVAGPAGIVFLQRGRRDVVAAPPDEHLIVAVLGGSLGLLRPCNAP